MESRWVAEGRESFGGYRMLKQFLVPEAELGSNAEIAVRKILAQSKRYGIVKTSPWRIYLPLVFAADDSILDLDQRQWQILVPGRVVLTVWKSIELEKNWAAVRGWSQRRMIANGRRVCVSS